MKTPARFVLALFLALLLMPHAIAGTVSRTFTESATIVPGNSVTIYMVAGKVVSTVSNDETAPPLKLFGLAPLMEIHFPLEHSWFIVKHVKFDKKHRRLTIDF